MITSIFLMLLTQLDGASPDALSVEVGPSTTIVSWSDAEDRLRGAVSPSRLVVGAPFELSLHVGTFEGPGFEGPVRVSFRPINATQGASVTVAMNAQAQLWRLTLEAAEPGPHTLEIAFTSTHHKVLKGRLEVVEPPLPRWPWLVVLGLAAIAALGFGARAALRPSSSSSPPPNEKQAPPSP